jgi:hypothetical protein
MRYSYVGIAPCGHAKRIFVADAATPADRAFVRGSVAETKAAGLRLILRERDEAVRLSLEGMDCQCGRVEVSE